LSELTTVTFKCSFWAHSS